MTKSNPPNAKQILRTVQGQLECDQLLGARWLPIGPLSDLPQEDLRMNTPLDDPIIKQKRQQLDAIAQQVQKCTGCPLHQSRNHGVPGEGNPNARLVFIGEAPGAEEDAQGHPFVGRAGKLLTNIIQAMGLTREQVFIGNILKCRPPDNRDPSPTEIAACSDYLYQQLEIIEPEIIVTLGAYAARTLLDTKDPIGRLRGRIHQYFPHPLAEPIKLVATYHPAYLLRNYTHDARKRVWEDMQMVLRELGLPIPQKNK